MKKILLLTFILSFFSFIGNDTNDLAKVNRIQGLYIFMDSQPAGKYTFIGRVKSRPFWSDEYADSRNKLIKATIKQYPNANGIIIQTDKIGQADAILIE